jgi:rhodanese-related sulfurtransferase
MSTKEPLPVLADPIAEISREELRRRLDDPSLTIVNVLPRESFLEGRIPRSVSLPLADVERCAAELLPDKGAEIAVYCASPT